APSSQADRLPRIAGAEAVISGSCSTATLAQVKAMRERRPVFDIDPLRLAAGAGLANAAVDWAAPHLGAGTGLVSAGATPDAVARVQEQLGRERAGSLVEAALAEAARRLVERGVRRLVVAGGETAGAVVKALGIKGLRIGKQIDPGVPWTVSLGDKPI